VKAHEKKENAFEAPGNDKDALQAFSTKV